MLRFLRFPIFITLCFLALPLFPLWGPFACFYLAKAIARRMMASTGNVRPALAAFATQLALFTPIMVSKADGGISLIFPWWTAFLTKSGDHIGYTISFLSILLFLPISIGAAIQVRREMCSHSLPEAQPTTCTQAAGEESALKSDLQP